MAASPDSSAAFVVANNCVYRLRPVAMTRQIDALLEGEQYETCLALCERCAHSDTGVAAKAPAVYRAYALTLFTKMEFDKAMGLFANCPPSVVDPREVLSLFPDLADKSLERAPDLEAAAILGASLKGHKLLRAQVHLIKYLRGVRQKIAASLEPSGASDKQQYVTGSDAAVDTAMLKALVRAEPENVLAFLQSANRCDLEVGQKLLTDYDRRGMTL